MDYSNKRLLIISNSVLSYTRGNGKTILSFFDSIPKDNVRQLYFSGEAPGVSGYNYYQLSDNDIIHGLISKAKRGEIHKNVTTDCEISTFAYRPARIKTPFFRLVRELLWHRKWKSPKLIEWLNEFQPTSIFFVAGDSLFAYEITEYITNLYHSRLSVFITDDYVMPRVNESIVSAFRRKLIIRKMGKSIKQADVFFTISEPMRQEYMKLFGKDSVKIVNMTESLEKKDSTDGSENKKIVMVYAGGLYYGREDVLHKIAEAIEHYNLSQPAKEAELKIYTNLAPSKEVMSKITIDNVSSYCGSLNQTQLAVELNRADILVFVESFDESQIEKTRFSLSTKVSEYLSLGKPIFAVGPANVGSMDYLQDVACCVFDEKGIDSELIALLENTSFQKEIGAKAKDKYIKNHNKTKIQSEIVHLVLG